MTKIIQSLTRTRIMHPAVGYLYQVKFTDNNEMLMYEESFYNIPNYIDNETNDNWLIGKTINLEKCIIERIQVN